MQHKISSFSMVGKSSLQTAIKKAVLLAVVMIVSFVALYMFFKLAILFDLDMDTPVREVKGFSELLYFSVYIFIVIPAMYYLGLTFMLYIFDKFDL